MKIVLLSAGILLGLAAIFAALLAFLGAKLAIKKDERIEEVTSCLSGANCGGCGFAGCAAFAEALVNGKADLSSCSATSKENKDKIASILGISNNSVDSIVVVACAGGNNCRDKYAYQGYGDCRSMNLLAGGRKACDTGCMGMGTCVDACPYHAIEVNLNGFAEINQDKCKKCGVCITACPKLLCKRLPSNAKVYVACSNHDKGPLVKKVCNVGCLACGLCAKVCPEKAITIDNNLAVIDYSKCVGCGLCADKCPTKAIHKL